MTPPLSIKSSALRIWTGQLKLRLEKDRQLYAGSSGQTITIVGRGEPELRAGRALLLAGRSDHLPGRVLQRGEREVKSGQTAARSLPLTPPDLTPGAECDV